MNCSHTFNLFVIIRLFSAGNPIVWRYANSMDFMGDEPVNTQPFVEFVLIYFINLSIINYSIIIYAKMELH